MGCAGPPSDNALGGEYLLDEDIEAKEGCDVTGSWDKASLYALWIRVFWNQPIL